MNADPTHSFLRESRRCRPLPHAVRAGPRAERCPSLGRARPGSGRAVGAAAQAAQPRRGPAEAGPEPGGPLGRGNSPGREGRGAGGGELRRGCSCAGKGVMRGGSIHGTGRDGARTQRGADFETLIRRRERGFPRAGEARSRPQSSALGGRAPGKAPAEGGMARWSPRGARLGRFRASSVRR